MPNREQQILMMMKPDNWPNWPALPLKRFTKKTPDSRAELQLGFLFNDTLEGDHKNPIVYIGSFYSSAAMTRQQQQVRYTCFAEIFDAGWRVD